MPDLVDAKRVLDGRLYAAACGAANELAATGSALPPRLGRKVRAIAETEPVG
jgi:hypothetical protein